MPADRAAWLEERKAGVGGSDISSVMNVGYGCARRLWYDKRNTPEDFPREDNLAQQLGRILEPFAAEQYTLQTGRAVSVIDAALVHPTIPELRVNVDRMIMAPQKTNGVLEIKCVGRAMFYKARREGLPPDYILQLQHAMVVTGATWGAFAVLSRDSGELLHWDVNKSEVIEKEILTEVPKFWSLVENGPAPERLDAEDPRCGRCEFRKQCQGNALIHVDDGEIKQDESLRPLLDEFLERKVLLAQAEELVDESGEELRTKLGDRQAVAVGDKKIYYRPSKGRTLYDGKALYVAYQGARKYLQSLITILPNEESIKALNMDKYPPLPPPEQFVDTGKPSRPLRIF